MKKYLFLSVAIVTTSVLFAQNNEVVIKGSKEISKELTPKVVIDSLHKRFPDAEAIQYFKADSTAIKNGWAITQEDNLDASSTIDRYTISFKRHNLKYYGLYKADGTLIMSKMQETDAELPEAVKTSLLNMAAGDYKGWKMQSKTYYKTMDYDKAKSYYEIVATKGSETKKVYLKPDGEVVKVK
jgi:hypothetical protein